MNWHKKNKTLEEAALLRDNVERITRHDIKTPLSGIISFSTLLMEKKLERNEEIKVLKMIEESSYKTLEMINISLDLSKMEAGTYQYRPEGVDISQVFKKILLETKRFADSKNLSVLMMLNKKQMMENERFFR